MIITVGNLNREVTKTQKRMDTHAEATAIADVLNNYYFKEIYEGDVDVLRKAFDSRTLLFGDINGQSYFKTLDQYLDGVAHRKSPKEAERRFVAEIISIEVIDTIAVAKTNVKIYDFNYWNFLTFHKIDGQWRIINKTLSHVPE